MDQPSVPPHPLPSYGDQPFSDQSKPAKTPVVRGARACTVCRQAKMKCVGAEDGNGPCQRCKRAGSDCIFEKHRRGRKPGSRLSEASKMLRRLEKGLSSAKAKSQTTDTPLPPPPSEASTSGQYRSEEGYSPGNSRFPNNELPPISSPYQEGFPRPSARSDVDMDEDDDEADRPEGSMFPVKMIRKERNSFFKTILNPEMPEPPPPRTSVSERSTSHTSSSPLTPSAPQPYPGLGSLSALKDPVELGWLDEEEVKNLFDMFYLRLNPFINLFDPALHSAAYVRARCPLLFTTMLMASCKFFKPELYAQLTRLANDFATRAFMEGWRRVEVVQAFACLTYWKEPTDTRVWMYIGYACRMAVDLRLNRYVGHRTQQESEFELRERRNRERTYLVLFVHDRSLSMQTGKLWMLPECELVRSAETWHEDGGMPMRQEDVIVAAFTHLRRFAADIAERLRNTVGCHGRPEHSQERLIQEVNARLNMWEKQWKHEMDRAGGDEFRYSFLRLFQLHARVFLNSFGVHAAMSQISHPNTQALHVCYNSALDELRIVAKDFATVSMLRYGQDSITVMTAYAAVFLLHMVRGLSAQLPEGARNEVYTVINKAADAYQDAASLIQAHSRSAVFHANFLRSLVVNDKHLHQQQQVQVGHDWSKPVLPPLNLRPSGSSSGGHLHLNGSSQSSVFSPSDSSQYFPSSMQNAPILPPVNSLSYSRDSGYSSGGSQPDSARNLGYIYPPPGANNPLLQQPNAPAQPSCEQELVQWQSTSREVLGMPGMGDGAAGFLGPIIGGGGPYSGGFGGGGFRESDGHGYTTGAGSGYGFQPVMNAYSGFASVGR